MNKGESAYAAHLDLLIHAGEIDQWEYEKIKIRLADNTFYTPDFFIIRPDRSIELHDVKGRSGDTFWAEEDAMVKIKVAAETFPARFFVVWPAKGGGWNKKEYNPPLEA